MKQGWEIKKLGEVCESDLGKTLNQSKDTGELRPYLCAVNVLWDKIDFTTLKETRFENAELERYTIKKGDLLICEGGDIGRAAIWNYDYEIQYQNALHRVRLDDSVRPRFLLLYLKHLKDSGVLDTRYGKGVTIKHLVKSSLLSIPIPVPPREEQERIVAELNCLSGIIERKREQLRELDALAQSIFYQMFGDPITNEKGWEVKKLGEVTILYNGRAFKPTDWSENGLPIVRIQNLNNRNASYNLYNGEVSNAHRLYGGELLYAWSGTPDTSFGAHIWYGTDAVLNQHIFKVEFDDNVLNKKFFLFLLNSQVHSMFDQTHGGVGLQHITKGTLTSQNVIIPHLALQKQFAEKIEKIEQQKKLISQSIKEVEDLFNSRMSYYFN